MSKTLFVIDSSIVQLFENFIIIFLNGVVLLLLLFKILQLSNTKNLLSDVVGVPFPTLSKVASAYIYI